jgi:NAD+ synthase (glutamine-hydrolysing)
LTKIAKAALGITIVVGFVDYDEAHLYNAAAMIGNGRILHMVHKSLLPTFDVFDEMRYFTPAKSNEPFGVRVGNRNILVGISLCEDIWDEEMGYGTPVVDNLCARGARIIVNVNA